MKGPNLKWLVSRAIYLARWRRHLHLSQCIRRIRPNCHGDGSALLGSIPRTNSAANRPSNRPRPHDRSGRRPRRPWQPRSRRRRPTPGPAAVSMERGEHRGGGIPRPSGRTQKRADAAPDKHHLAVEGHTQSLRPKRANCRFSSSAPPSPIRRSTSRHILISRADHATGVDCCVARRPVSGRANWREAAVPRCDSPVPSRSACRAESAQAFGPSSGNPARICCSCII